MGLFEQSTAQAGKKPASCVLNRGEGIFCLVLVSASIVFFAVKNYPYLYSDRLWPDEALYSWYALETTRSPLFLIGPEHRYPPLFTLILIAGDLFLPSPLGYHFAVLTLGISGLIFIYLLGRRAGGGFCGAFAVLGLTFNYPYFRLSTYSLTDVPLTVLFLAMGWALLNVENNGKGDRWVSFIGCLLILLKWSAVILFPWVGIYYLSVFNGNALAHRLRRLVNVLLPPFLVMILLLAKNFYFSGHFFPSLTALRGAYFVAPGYYYLTVLNQLFAPFVIFFIPLGVIHLFSRGKKSFVLLLSWSVLFWVIYSMVPEKILRYVLPVIPAVILISGLGFQMSVDFCARYAGRFALGLSLFVFGLCLIVGRNYFYSFIQKACETSAWTYRGFYEAAAWIRDQVERKDGQTAGKTSEAPLTITRESRQRSFSGDGFTNRKVRIFCGSPRAMRYALSRSWGGKPVTCHLIPEDRMDFEKQVQSFDGKVFLEIDRWEYTQPSWIVNFSKETEEFLRSMGLKARYIIWRDFDQRGKMQSGQMIRIYERETFSPSPKKEP